MNKHLKKLIKRFIDCEFYTHRFENPEEVRPQMIRKVHSYVTRINLTHNVKIHHIDYNQLVIEVYDTESSFFVNIDNTSEEY